MNESIAVQLVETIMKRFPCSNDYPYKSWTYFQAFVLLGILHLYEKTKEERYYSYLMEYCEIHVDENGRVGKYTGENLDEILPGTLLVWAYKETKLEKYKIACDTIRENYNDYPRNSNGGFWHGKQLINEMWIDGLFMNLMFLSAYGMQIQDKEYCIQETMSQLKMGYDCCQKENTGLLYHAYTECKATPWRHPLTGTSSEVWSEGEGWYALILIEVLEMLPEDAPMYKQIKMQYLKLADSLKKLQKASSGLWYQVVDKPKFTGNFEETSGSAMFAYSLHKGVRVGLLEKKEYENTLLRAREGLMSKIQKSLDGKINIYDACDGVCVQQNYDQYVGYPRVVNAKEAVGAVLWALTEYEFYPIV